MHSGDYRQHNMKFKTIRLINIVVSSCFILFACNRSVVGPISNAAIHSITYIGPQYHLCSINADGTNNHEIDTIDAAYLSYCPGGAKIALYTDVGTPPNTELWVAIHDVPSKTIRKLAYIFGQNGNTIVSFC